MSIINTCVECVVPMACRDRGVCSKLEKNLREAFPPRRAPLKLTGTMMSPKVDLPKTTATWLLELNCTCPHCEQEVDLIDASDFWERSRLSACENGTDQSRDVRVDCPKCEESFRVSCEY